MNKKILWFDIETAPEVNQSEFNTYPKKWLWENKMIEKWITTTFERSYMEKASIYPEFAKVVCISYLVDNQMKSLIGQDEAMLLMQFNDVLAFHQDATLGGFNINEFDIPFLWKRMMINGIKPHKKLCIGNAKSWEVDTVDVFKIRKQTSFGCSLDLLSMTLLGESPKSDMSWENVAYCYYANNLSMIKEYCEGDVQFTERCYKKLSEVGKCKPDPNPRPKADTQAPVEPVNVDELFAPSTETEEEKKAACGLPF